MILQRITGERFSEVVPNWNGAMVVLLGGGPSLTKEQVRLVEVAHKQERVKCIAVNDSYLLAPWADAHYAADHKWHGWHSAGIAKPSLGLTAEQVRERWAAFAGQKCSIQTGKSIDEAVHVLRNPVFPNHSYGLSLDRKCLVSGRCSGFQALNLAILAGARSPVLLGYDAKEWDPKKHWHEGHPSPDNPQVYPEMRKAFSAAERAIAKAGVRVFNCSPGSALGFDHIDLAVLLQQEVTTA